MFIFNDKSIRVSLENETYSFLSYSQSSFSITDWSGIVRFRSSNMSFVYSENSSVIYGFCESFLANELLSGCGNGLSCQADNCR